ncbi:MAG: 3-phosphoshikimate 1-carboxyvinyltransferase [Clostridia bacterium]|nr:3-phosphoshikimate 1-carboxyvinyltransferase [Clostridia bacterium]
MKVKVFPHTLNGALDGVKSKSYAHRMLIAAALSGGALSYGESDDAHCTAHALETLGFEAKYADRSVYYGDFNRPAGKVEPFVGESGSTLRFLLPLALALGVEASFRTAGRLAERPMTALTETLAAHGAEIEGLTVRGQLKAGIYEIDATISSQFVTGLLMSLPLLEGDSEIVLLGRAVSAPYIDITLEVLRAAEIVIERTKRGFFVRGGQRYRLKRADVPADFSGAAFPIVAGALGGAVTVRGLDLSSAQGDKAIVEVVRKAGALVRVSEDAVEVKKGALRGFVADAHETPDLAPILSVLASYCTGESVLQKVSRLRDKESDRLMAIEDMLSRAGIETHRTEDDLVIVGGRPQGAAFHAFADHRMAMSEAILAAYAEGESEIDDMTCVKKSYPEFWQDFGALGGKYEVEG